MCQWERPIIISDRARCCAGLGQGTPGQAGRHPARVPIHSSEIAGILFLTNPGTPPSTVFEYSNHDMGPLDMTRMSTTEGDGAAFFVDSLALHQHSTTWGRSTAHHRGPTPTSARTYNNIADDVTTPHPLELAQTHTCHNLRII
jgi:hypothetical protein